MARVKASDAETIGIDVAKDKLDICYLPANTYECWGNVPSAIKVKVAQVKRSGFNGLVILEFTGGYEKVCRKLFNEAGIKVHVAHPRRAYHFAQQKRYFGKTDKLDARMLAEYGRQEDLEPTPPVGEAEEERQALAVRREQLVAFVATEKARLKAHVIDAVRTSLERSIKENKKEIERTEAAIAKNIEQDKQAAQNAELLQSVEGVGRVTAYALICLVPELGQLDRRGVACLVGVAPRSHDSGKLKGKRRIMGGRSQARKALYMAALASITHNPVMKEFYQQLKAQGKPSKVCLVAVMRKLIITLNAMLRDGKSWEAGLNDEAPNSNMSTAKK